MSPELMTEIELLKPLHRLPGGLLVALLLIAPMGGCDDSDYSGTASSPCGDGYCLDPETSETCPRDCPYECVPGDTRCVANSLLTCRDDGLSEQVTFCANDQVCTTEGCQPSPDLTPDAGLPDIVSDPIDDLPDDLAEDAPFDFSDEATGTADQ